MDSQHRSTLTDVPETMLWTLHNRAFEAMRRDGVLDDPTAVEIFSSIDYNYRRRFGRPDASHALRSLVFDRQIKRFLAGHPDAVIVNLGEGLETQRFRVSAPRARWITVDLPESIEIREKFIEPDAEHLHVPRSALDRRWFEAVPPDREVIVTAQGLFMYFEAADVRSLLQDLVQGLRAKVVVFDIIPRWLSRFTLRQRGLPLTPFYRTPPMPWGLDASDIQRLVVNGWLGGAVEAEKIPYPTFPRGLTRVGSWIWQRGPWIRHRSPAIVQLTGPGRGV